MSAPCGAALQGTGSGSGSRGNFDNTRRRCAMPEFVTDGVIPPGFVDYSRRLIAYTTASDAADRAFQGLFPGLFDVLQRRFGADDTVMAFRLGNTHVGVFYLRDESAVAEAIQLSF